MKQVKALVASACLIPLALACAASSPVAPAASSAGSTLPPPNTPTPTPTLSPEIQALQTRVAGLEAIVPTPTPVPPTLTPTPVRPPPVYSIVYHDLTEEQLLIQFEQGEPAWVDHPAAYPGAITVELCRLGTSEPFVDLTFGGAENRFKGDPMHFRLNVTNRDFGTRDDLSTTHICRVGVAPHPPAAVGAKVFEAILP